MDDLLRKLESAKCGSRKLDALIWAEQDGRDLQYDSNGPLGACRMLGRSKEPPHDICVIGSYLSEFTAIASFPHYTTSLDAALTLVPEGFTYNLYGPRDWFPSDDRYCASATVTGPKGGREAEARTLPLALSAAALKARQ